jgi:AAA+ ATPase superfamily predicted ATPase
MLEIENYDAVKTIISRDYETFSGKMLERYFKRVLVESKAYTRIGSWWDRKGENEIDIVAENELNDEAVFIEVKRKEETSMLSSLMRKWMYLLAPQASLRTTPCRKKACQ